MIQKSYQLSYCLACSSRNNINVTPNVGDVYTLKSGNIFTSDMKSVSQIAVGYVNFDI